MQKVILTVGIPASLKSTWAIKEVAKDPLNWARVNNDMIREMLNSSVYSTEYEKLITSMRRQLITTALKAGKNVIIDNINAGKRNFEEVINLTKKVKGNFEIFEKPFYVELEEAIARDAKREGNAKVGEDVIKNFWKKLGGKQHKFYNPRKEFVMNQHIPSSAFKNPNGIKAIISDLDGTLSLFNKPNEIEMYEDVHIRNPYNAENCQNDGLNEAVAKVIELFNQQGYEIIFVSGRICDYRPQTVSFIEKHFPGMKYSLFMRKSNDFRKDSIIKEEIFEEHIREKYNVLFIMDDRDQTCEGWRKIGLKCFQVAEGNF